MIQLAREAEQMCAVDPLPETLEGNYKYLRDNSDRAAKTLLEMRNGLKQWENEIENAVRKGSVHHAIKFGSQVSQQRDEMEHSPHWPPDFVKESNSLIDLARELIAHEVANWIPRQICHSAAQVADFRRRTEKDAEGLEKLGFHKEAQALTHQAQQSIHKVEKLQQFSLTLAQCNDYPRQPEPTTRRRFGSCAMRLHGEMSLSRGYRARQPLCRRPRSPHKSVRSSSAKRNCKQH